MVPVSEIGDGLHIGIVEHASPFGRIRFSAQTVSAPNGARYTVLVGEGSQVVVSAVKTVVIALADRRTDRHRRLGRRHLHARGTVDAIGRCDPLPGRRYQHV